MIKEKKQLICPRFVHSYMKEKYNYILSFPIKNVLKALTTLTSKEKQVLLLRMRERTLQEIALLFGLTTKEAIRQIESKALRKLSHPHRMKILKGIDVSMEQFENKIYLQEKKAMDKKALEGLFSDNKQCCDD